MQINHVARLPPIDQSRRYHQRVRTRTPRSENSREPVEQGLLAKALAMAADPIFITDHTGCIVWVNTAFSERSGFSPQEAVGQTPSFLNSGRHDASFYLDLWLPSLRRSTTSPRQTRPARMVCQRSR